MVYLPNVSVIVPNYNHARFLNQRIDSILNQTYQDFELILLDDCSTDDSRNILISYSNNSKVSCIVINDENSGSTFKQWKKGIELAKGKYIWIAESDDCADIEFLDQLCYLMDQNKDITLSYCRTYRIDESDKILGINPWGEYINPQRWENNFINSGNDEIEKFLIHRNTISNASAVVFRRDKAIETISKVTNFRFCGDWLFWSFMIFNSKIAYVSKPLNYYRRYSNATSLQKNQKVIIQRVTEYNKVIENIGRMIKQKYSHVHYEHQWILDEWFSSRKIINIFNFIIPPVYCDLKIIFYKQLSKKILHIK